MNQILEPNLLTPEAADELSPAPRVLVTGGAGGLGKAIARRFQATGAQVHVADRSAARLADTLAAIPGIHGSHTDVTDPEQVASLFDEVTAWLDGIDVLVNAARYVGPRSAVEDTDFGEWQRTLETNVTGTFLCVRQFAAHFKEQGSGCIVNIGSSSARTGLPRRLAYVTCGSALIGLTYNLARELGPHNIRCNAVLGGMIESSEGRRLVESEAKKKHLSLEEAEAEVLRHVSMRTWIDPNEVAETVVYLSSAAARHINGQVLSVCGNVEWEG